MLRLGKGYVRELTLLWCILTLLCMNALDTGLDECTGYWLDWSGTILDCHSWSEMTPLLCTDVLLSFHYL